MSDKQSSDRQSSEQQQPEAGEAVSFLHGIHLFSLMLGAAVTFVVCFAFWRTLLYEPPTDPYVAEARTQLALISSLENRSMLYHADAQIAFAQNDFDEAARLFAISAERSSLMYPFGESEAGVAAKSNHKWPRKPTASHEIAYMTFRMTGRADEYEKAMLLLYPHWEGQFDNSAGARMPMELLRKRAGEAESPDAAAGE